MNTLEAETAQDQLLAECATLEYILLGDLRDLLEEDPADEMTVRWLLAVLDALLDTLPREFALKEEGGYLSEVLEQYPNWSNHVDRLQAEREQLFEQLRILRERIANLESFADIADLVRAQLRDWITGLTAYHRHERRLVQSAFNIEVGGGD